MAGSETAPEKDILRDLRSGMTDEELMQEYRLTARGLGSLLRDLVDAKAISVSELLRRSTVPEDVPELLAEFRVLPRNHVGFPLPIYEAQHPELRGVVCDITVDGVGTRGLNAKLDEIKTFVIPADEFFQIGPIVFQGLCCWTEEGADEGGNTAGFRVVEILKGSMRELQKLIQALSVTDANG
ncbi:MAG: hypothetical protein HY914_00635 [Desulfomonile tiedjei]|nr:hypothetical protein [Desulfomonile tiedjei]